MADNQDQIKETITQLQRPIEGIQTLLSLLAAPLDSLGILPPQFRKYNANPLPPHSVSVSNHIPQIQRALLEHILPTWDAALKDHRPDATHLVKQYFCPDSFVNALPVSGNLALKGYETILTGRLNSQGIQLLESLNRDYPIDRLWTAVFAPASQTSLAAQKERTSAMRDLMWEDCVKDVVSVPAKVANAIASSGNGRIVDVPSLLENGTFLNQVCMRVEVLVERLAKQPTKDWTTSLNYLVTKLVNVGAFPPSPPTARSQPSFWQTNIPIIRQKLRSLPESRAYSLAWRELILNVPSTITLRSVLISLFNSLDPITSSTDASPSARARVKSEAKLLLAILGNLIEDDEQLWDTVTSLILGRDWDESYGRIFVCWVAGPEGPKKVDTKALRAFLEAVVDAWSTPDHIKRSFLSRHRYLTSLFLLTVSYLPPSSKDLEVVIFSPVFMKGVGDYISHLDTSIRRCGMLVAEIVAQMTGKKLAFGDWEGDDSGKPWCRQIRALIKSRDVDADISVLEISETHETPSATAGVVETNSTITEPSVAPAKATFKATEAGYDSDDSLVGYESQPSSRSASPTPSELEEIEKDPTLNVGVKKVSRPVYLAQLGDLIRGTGPKLGSDEPHEADKIKMALDYGEELIRKKRGYGTELEENAVNLVYGFLALHDNFDLTGFDEKRQGAMNALVACAPRKAPPALIEEFFKNQYSVDQRHVALNSLAVGARELASLPIPPSQVSQEKVAFPSKMLPGTLHKRYLAASRANATLLPSLVEDLSRKAIDRGKEVAEDKVPEIVREKRLKIHKTPPITEVRESDTLAGLRSGNMPPTKKTTFTDVAAEFFIGPLINRFWLFLRDEQAREERTSQQVGRQKYHSSGTGLILNPLVISQFLRTLTVLVNAAQNAPEWLAVLSPGSLEIAITVGTQPISDTEPEPDVDVSDPQAERENKEAAVLTAALELALIVLDGCVELDGGKTLGLEHTNLLFGTGEWAGAVFAKLDKGLRMQGGGGVNEAKLQRAAASVLLKVDEVTSKWRRSMIDIR